MGRFHLATGERLQLPANACQEVLVLVEKGEVHVGGQSVSRGRGGAFRLHEELPIQASDSQGASLLVAAVRAPKAIDGEAPRWTVAPDPNRCPPPSKALVLADPARTGPFLHTDDRLRVNVYLGSESDPQARATLGTLEGDAMLGVPEHLHEVAAEVLWIERGSGTMRLGDRTVPIGPGTFVYVPPNTVHGFIPDGSSALLAYQIYTPPGPEQRFRIEARSR